MMKEYYTHYPRTILWLVPGGEVTIGGAELDAQPLFKAEVEPFYLSKFPITNEQYEAFAPQFERLPTSLGDRDPAVGLNFEEACDYAAWYAHLSRKPMRLPTEVEWEYACRAGTTGRTFFDQDADPSLYLWDGENSGSRIPPLDEKKANEFGFFGMLGGVWEWTDSMFRSYPLGEDGVERAGAPRILRGGSFRSPREQISCSLRRSAAPLSCFDDAGFRLARSLRNQP
jgi:formylglycine-generating enzyme required for sulfatase activity